MGRVRDPAPPSAPFSLDCPHFSSCSGCSLDEGLDAPPLLAEARAYFASRGLPGRFELDTGPVHGWRTRAKLAVRGSPSGPGLAVGLFERGSHRVADIVPGCRAHHPAINEVADLVRRHAERLGVRPFWEPPPPPPGQKGRKTAHTALSPQGDLRYLQLAVGDGGERERAMA